MKKSYLLLLLLLPLMAHAQPNWSENVSSILFNNCTSCHNPNGIGPFSLMTYNDANAFSGSIKASVLSKEMPPWMADTSYKSHLHERILTLEEINTIADWVDAGAPLGDSMLAPPPPVFSSDGILSNPDLIVKMPVYTSKAQGEDDYICIALPTGLTTTRKIKAVEIIPGNRAIVHHALLFVDGDAIYVSDTVGGDCGGPTSGDLVTAYAPGGQPTMFPNGGDFKTGITMPAGSNIILAMHYPEGSAGMKDSTEVHFIFYDENETGVREIYADRLVENWTFCIPADQTKTLTYAYPSLSGTTNSPYSVLSVFPHMHLLGTSMKSFAVLPSQDTTKLINLPEWDFEWQDFYFFKKPQMLPIGSRLYGTGTYDNTSSNPNNPSNPPVTVCAGLNTKDEMFIFYYHYMDYQTGDENINIDSLMAGPTAAENISFQNGSINSFPNPFSDQIGLEITLEINATVGVYIYDIKGHLMEVLLPTGTKLNGGTHQFLWDGSHAAPGVYFYSTRIDGEVYTGKLVKL
jgi:hypothetical protein